MPFFPLLLFYQSSITRPSFFCDHYLSHRYCHFFGINRQYQIYGNHLRQPPTSIIDHHYQSAQSADAKKVSLHSTATAPEKYYNYIKNPSTHLSSPI
ncbi:hypothetical protein [Ignatzschineria cameli]|uniref:hypothetical protein n=1 Tax=Ignatzschineria cameli TaxID=2182793 RepID=UPI0010582371|nr:hypothetical protein [Ignatzschineria cameli]